MTRSTLTLTLTLSVIPALVVVAPAQEPGPTAALADLIAFTSGGSVSLIDLNTGKIRKLGIDLGHDRPLTWSPDGRFVLAWRHGDVGWDVWRIPVSGSDPVNLTHTKSGGCRMAQYSPDGSMIAFMRDQPNGLHVMAADGSTQRQLTRRGHRDERPSWSPDGKRLLYGWFDRSKDGRLMSRIGIVNVDTGDEQPLMPSFHTVGEASYAPNDARIVFRGRTRPGTADLYVLPADGGDPINLTNTVAFNEDRPVWSPDGKRIAYEISMKVGSHLCVVDVATRKVHTLSQGVGVGDYSFGPDGRLACVLGSRGEQALHVASIGEDGKIELKKVVDEASFIAWRPRP